MSDVSSASRLKPKKKFNIQTILFLQEDLRKDLTEGSGIRNNTDLDHYDAAEIITIYNMGSYCLIDSFPQSRVGMPKEWSKVKTEGVRLYRSYITHQQVPIDLRIVFLGAPALTAHNRDQLLKLFTLPAGFKVCAISCDLSRSHTAKQDQLVQIWHQAHRKEEERRSMIVVGVVDSNSKKNRRMVECFMQEVSRLPALTMSHVKDTSIEEVFEKMSVLKTSLQAARVLFVKHEGELKASIFQIKRRIRTMEDSLVTGVYTRWDQMVDEVVKYLASVQKCYPKVIVSLQQYCRHLRIMIEYKHVRNRFLKVQKVYNYLLQSSPQDPESELNNSQQSADSRHRLQILCRIHQNLAREMAQLEKQLAESFPFDLDFDLLVEQLQHDRIILEFKLKALNEYRGRFLETQIKMQTQDPTHEAQQYKSNHEGKYEEELIHKLGQKMNQQYGDMQGLLLSINTSRESILNLKQAAMRQSTMKQKQTIEVDILQFLVDYFIISRIQGDEIINIDYETLQLSACTALVEELTQKHEAVQKQIKVLQAFDLHEGKFRKETLETGLVVLERELEFLGQNWQIVSENRIKMRKKASESSI